MLVGVRSKSKIPPAQNTTLRDEDQTPEFDQQRLDYSPSESQAQGVGTALAHNQKDLQAADFSCHVGDKSMVALVTTLENKDYDTQNDRPQR